jgi:hypothetical protein
MCGSRGCMLLQIKRFCIMNRVVRLSLCMLLLLSLWHGAHGARILRAGVQGELPPCKDVPGGIQNWGCYDPPSTPLPPCDFKHHSPGIDCNTDRQKPPSPKAKLALTDISSAGGACAGSNCWLRAPRPGALPWRRGSIAHDGTICDAVSSSVSCILWVP